VVRLRTRDQHRALRLPAQPPVAARDLAGGLDGVGSARCQEDGGVVERSDRGEAVGQLERRAVGVGAERRIRGQVTHLGGGDVGELGAPVSDVAVPQACGRVEVAPALLVLEPGAVAADEHELAPRHPRHIGEGMPQALWVLVHCLAASAVEVSVRPPWQRSGPRATNDVARTAAALYTRSCVSAVAPDG
jgi:hypothetical protein